MQQKNALSPAPPLACGFGEHRHVDASGSCVAERLSGGNGSACCAVGSHLFLFRRYWPAVPEAVGCLPEKVGAITWEDQGQCLHHPPLAGHAFVSYFTHPHCHAGFRPVKSLAHLNLGVRSSFRSGASDDTTAACSKCTPGGAVCAWDVSSLARPYSVRGLELICPPRPQKP